MVQMFQLNPKERKQSFGESIGLSFLSGIGEHLKKKNESKMQKEALKAQEQSKIDLLEKEYGLKGELEKGKQEAKYSEKIKAYEKFRKNMGEDLKGTKSLNESDLGDKPPHTQSEIDATLFFDPQIANSYEKQNEEWFRQKRHEEEKSEKKGVQERKIFESDRDYHSKTSEPILKSAQSVVKETPIKKGLRQQMRRDIVSGNTEGIIPYLVEKTGLETYRNPESSRFKNISKQLFVESLHSLGSAGARPNQFIEQQLVGAQPALGRSVEANETILDLDEFVDDLKDQRAKIELELGEEDMRKHGYAKNDISIRADKKMEEYTKQRQEQMAYDIRKRNEQNKSNEELAREIISGKVVPDTPLTLRMARILMIKNNDDEKKAMAEAKKLGFTIPSEMTYLRDMK